MLAGACASTAAPVIYDYTATVTSSAGALAGDTVGSIVTGAYTINVSAANPAQSTAVSPISAWLQQSYGGAYYPGSPPLPRSFVFSTTLVAPLGYATAATFGSYGEQSLAEGGGLTNYYSMGSEVNRSSSTSDITSSTLSLLGSTLDKPAFTHPKSLASAAASH